MRRPTHVAPVWRRVGEAGAEELGADGADSGVARPQVEQHVLPPRQRPPQPAAHGATEPLLRVVRGLRG